MKRALILLFLVVAAGAAVWHYYPGFFEEAPPTNTLTVSGNIEAHESLLGFRVPGRVVELLAEEGQWVTAGTKLARLEDSDYRQQVSVDEASLRVRQAELKLALAGTREQEIKAAEQAVRDAQADLEQKKLDYQRAQTLYAKDAVSEQARDLAKTNLERAQATYQRAQERYDEAQEGTRPEEIAIARANVKRAQATTELARINLGYTTLVAPADGVIVVRQAEHGEVVAPGTPIYTLADLDHVWLRAYISETDLGRVKWGQEAALTTDTYPGKTYHGRISFISSKAEFTPKSVETHQERVTLVYRIKIDVDNPNHELKPGMPADAQIELAPR